MASAVLYCLWLVPAPKPAQKLADIIENLADEHRTQEFQPHMTLAAAKDRSSGQNGEQNRPTPEQAEGEAVKWLKATASSPNACQFNLQLGPATVGQTRHQCILTASEQSGEGHETLIKLREDCFREVKELSALEVSNANPEYYPHISLMYSDCSQSERTKICETVKGCDIEVEMAGLELWKVFLDKPESAWKMLDCVDLRAAKTQTPPPATKNSNAKNNKEEEEERQEEGKEESDDDWEASVEGFTAKVSLQDKPDTDEWEVRGDAMQGSAAFKSTGEGAGLYAELTTENILEAFAFPPHLDAFARAAALGPLAEAGAAVQSVDGDSFLVVFRSQRKAEAVLAAKSAAPYRLRRYAEASAAARGISLHSIVRPPRPQTSATVANRLIRASLGSQVRGPKKASPGSPGSANSGSGEGEGEGEGRERAGPKRPERGVYRPPGRR